MGKMMDTALKMVEDSMGPRIIGDPLENLKHLISAVSVFPRAAKDRMDLLLEILADYQRMANNPDWLDVTASVNELLDKVEAAKDPYLQYLVLALLDVMEYEAKDAGTTQGAPIDDVAAKISACKMVVVNFSKAFKGMTLGQMMEQLGSREKIMGNLSYIAGSKAASEELKEAAKYLIDHEEALFSLKGAA